ncbi:metal ABC transporter solute-binding protein, Zn/Mn family [Calothrix rhizosoleniae]|uniref:metal ABC transporter solute-binding protein, Zn/Mn family n=1 Tax=Calothrix rhizosoleniae TaxID=888997 RepID=UPI000B4989AB|nr:zinc ABC transporter substrate-binding protein [Calothrix rhizosoleniae]
MSRNIPLNAFAALILGIGLIGCSSTPEANSTSNRQNSSTTTTITDKSVDTRPSVVATTSVLCDLTKQIAADTVNLKCLVAAGEDPHTYKPKPSDRQDIETANLILYGGYDFEPSIIKLVQASKTPSKIAVHEVAVPKPIITEEHHHHHHHGEKEEKHSEKEEKVADPHVWHNAQNGINMVKVISSNLKKISPKNSELYVKNSEKVTNELQQINSWIKTQIVTIPAKQRQLITTHDALGYYVQTYGLKFAGALEGLSTEEQPTAAKLGKLVKKIKKENVPTIFAENAQNPKLIERVAKEANVKVSQRKIYADGLGEQGSEASTYQKMLIANTRTIVEGLGGKYTDFTRK